MREELLKNTEIIGAGPRIGIEMEFQVSTNTRIGPLAPELNDQLPICTDDFFIGSDVAGLVEFRSYPIDLDLWDYDFHVASFRIKCSLWLRSIGADFIYYGTHLSWWGLNQEIPVRLVNPILEMPAERYLSSFFVKKWKGNETWETKDPFTGSSHRHRFISKDEADTKDLVVDETSLSMSMGWLKENCQFLKSISNRYPVPGCAVRVSRYRRCEMIIGWLEPKDEKELFNRFLQMSLPEDDSWKSQPEEVILMCSPKKKFAGLILQGKSFDSEPTMPNMNWFCVQSQYPPSSTPPFGPGDIWPVIGVVDA